MSTIDDSGKEPEQQTQPVAEAGGEGKVDRSVQGTDLRSGFAELRARVTKERDEAKGYANYYFRKNLPEQREICITQEIAFDCVLKWLDAIEADAKDASTGS
jgi:hypothetical protein